ncbi:MAG: CRTAC1 family protein [Acidobacteria bacterium]|nr:MAG: CRTAC1 family protein [Acidobacteriota bacterium]
MTIRVPGLFLAVTCVTAAGAMQPASPAAILFRDITKDAGITFEHHAAPEKKFIVESMSGGVALFDYDNDGLPDIYFVDSLTVETAGNSNAAQSALYHNLGSGRFEDVTGKSGLAHPGWGMGVCTGDENGDGWEDVYVTAIGGNHLYRNRHDGTFEDVTERAGVGASGWSAGCGFADYDRDGHLDLFVSRYVKIDLAHLPEFGKDKTCEYRGIAVQCGPRGLQGESDLLFRNDGNGRFTDVSDRAGVSDPRGYFGLGIAWFDYNDDGWPDLYVANDSTPNFMYVNQKNGTFKEQAFPLGVAVSEDGAEQGSMGVALGDYDHSGRFSLFVTNFAEEYNALYHNDGDHFSDVSFRSRTAASSLPYVGWGDAFLDYDNDTWADIIAINGHVYPQLDKVKMGVSAGYRQRKLLYRNRGDGTFEDVSTRFGPVLTEPRVSRGLAMGDIDNDGRVDVVINDLDGGPQVLHNELTSAGNWVIVKLKGAAPNTDAIGAVITVTTGAVRQRALIQSGTSYISQNDMRQHFGLGSAEVVDSIEVRWPDGTTTKQERVKGNQIVTITK